MRDKFEDIRTFVAVVQARGFAQAGKRLGIAKSAVSRRVNDLEDRLGTRLLNRTTRQLSPTPAGAELYQRGLRLLADFQEAEDAVSSGSNEPAGKLRISAPVSFGSHCLGRIIPEFMSRFPRLQVELELEDRLIDLVASGFDVAVRISRLKDFKFDRAEDRYDTPCYLRQSGISSAPRATETSGRPSEAHDAAIFLRGRLLGVYKQRSTFSPIQIPLQ